MKAQNRHTISNAKNNYLLRRIVKKNIDKLFFLYYNILCVVGKRYPETAYITKSRLNFEV